MRVVFHVDNDGRECSKCSEYKLWSNFHKNSSAPFGRNSYCNSCKAAKWIKDNPRRICKSCGGRIRDDNKADYCTANRICLNLHNKDLSIKGLRNDSWRKNNRVKWVLVSAKQRAKRRGTPFDVTAEVLPPIPAKCPVFGLPLGWADNLETPTLDCVNPRLGYVAGNLQWLSGKANRMKSDATQDELNIFARWVQATTA